MKLPVSDKALVWLARYMITVLIATVVLTALRWDSGTGMAGAMDLIATSVWQASVWPLYLVLRLFA